MSVVDLFTFPHFYFMLSTLVLISIGVYFVLTHKPENWFFLHKLFMGLGLIVAILGLITVGALMLSIIHLILGLITIILLALTIMGGWYANKKGDMKLRSGHIWFGRIVYLVTFIVIIIGSLSVVGIL